MCIIGLVNSFRALLIGILNNVYLGIILARFKDLTYIGSRVRWLLALGLVPLIYS